MWIYSIDFQRVNINPIKKYLLFSPNKQLQWVWQCSLTEHKGFNSQLDLLLPVVLTQRTLATIPTATATASQLFKMLMSANRRGLVYTRRSEVMFWLFRVSVSIFLGLTDRPINLIYRVSPHPLTSSTGLLSNNKLLSLGTIGVLVPIAFVLQLLRWQDRGLCTPVLPEQERPCCCSCCLFCDWYTSRGVAWTSISVP